MKLYKYMNAQFQTVEAPWKQLPLRVKEYIKAEKRKRKQRINYIRRKREARALELRAADKKDK
jgi:hypothetical protein